MFDWIASWFESWFWSVPPRRHKLSKTCRECGRTYSTTDKAQLCSDWDRVLGLNRHSYKK